MPKRFIGIDIGAETIKAVVLDVSKNAATNLSRRAILEHHKEPLDAFKRFFPGFFFLPPSPPKPTAPRSPAG
jgi:activator of 2-hydroxyglutaryl-CoA dehydratase